MHQQDVVRSNRCHGSDGEPLSTTVSDGIWQDIQSTRATEEYRAIATDTFHSNKMAIWTHNYIDMRASRPKPFLIMIGSPKTA